MKKHEFIKDTDENGNEIISVSDKPKRRLDLIPRLICVLVAFIIWIWMVNLNDTDLTEKLTFDIELVGVTLNDDNMMIIENGDDDIIIYGVNRNKVSVTVQGSNRDIRRFEDENGKITIDAASLNLSDIAADGSFTIPFEFDLPEGSDLKIIESEPLEITFFADEYVENAEIPLRVASSEELSNTVIQYKFSPEITGWNENGTVNVSGPEKIISQIASVKVAYDANFVNSKDELELVGFPIEFIGVDGKEIDVMNSVTCNTDGVSVLVKANGTMTLNIHIDCKNENVEIKCSVNSIEVSGPPSAINQVRDEDYVITIGKSEAKAGTTIIHKPDLGIEGLTVKPTTGIPIEFIAKPEN